MARRQGRKMSENIATIKNEYVDSLQQKKDRRKLQKKGLRRRLTVFSIVVVITFSILTYTLVGQKKVIAAKEQERALLQTELAEKEEEHAILTRQLDKLLNDDEYIAKLARHEYFLSDKNEIIFSLPKNDGKEKKKEAEKE